MTEETKKDQELINPKPIKIKKAGKPSKKEEINDVETIRVSYTNKATIPSGEPYTNVSPSYTVTREFKIPQVYGNEELIDIGIKTQLDLIKHDIDARIMKDFEEYKNFLSKPKIQPIPDHHRITIVDGIKYPHVSEIINALGDSKQFIKHLDEHIELGNEFDTLLKKYVDNFDLYIDDLEAWFLENMNKEFIDKGNIKQTYHEVVSSVVKVLKKKFNDIKLCRHSIKIVNKKDIFTGELDFLGFYKQEPAIYDAKKRKSISQKDLHNYFMQMASYIKSLPDIEEYEKYKNCKYMIVLSPYGIKVSDEIDKYFNEFLKLRKKYKETYGV